MFVHSLAPPLRIYERPLVVQRRSRTVPCCMQVHLTRSDMQKKREKKTHRRTNTKKKNPSCILINLKPFPAAVCSWQCVLSHMGSRLDWHGNWQRTHLALSGPWTHEGIIEPSDAVEKGKKKEKRKESDWDLRHHPSGRRHDTLRLSWTSEAFRGPPARENKKRNKGGF